MDENNLQIIFPLLFPFEPKHFLYVLYADNHLNNVFYHNYYYLEHHIQGETIDNKFIAS